MADSDTGSTVKRSHATACVEPSLDVHSVPGRLEQSLLLSAYIVTLSSIHILEQVINIYVNTSTADYLKPDKKHSSVFVMLRAYDPVKPTSSSLFRLLISDHLVCRPASRMLILRVVPLGLPNVTGSHVASLCAVAGTFAFWYHLDHLASRQDRRKE